MLKLILVTLSILTITTNAWWCTGHMIIASIAKRHLMPNVETTINDVVANLREQGPFPMCSTFVPCACWSDDLNQDGIRAMDGWHFINQPYNPTNYPVNPPPVVQQENVANQIRSLEATAKQYKYINSWARQFGVVNLLHFLGDVHQPLHAAEWYSAQFPTGDKGGRDVPVWVNGVQWSLHHIWDSVCTLYSNTPHRPPSQETTDWLNKLAEQYDTNYSSFFNESMLKESNSTIMAQQSFQVAVEAAYNGVTVNMNITQQYLDRCVEYASKQLVLAGYRLAHEMNSLFWEYTPYPAAPEMPPAVVQKEGKH